jgi:hypothetical protein
LILILDHWRRRWQSVSFDTANGKGHVRWLSRRPKTGIGWATKHGNEWFALWSNGKNIIFQAGMAKFQFVEMTACSNVRRGGSRHLLIEEAGSVIFDVVYRAVDRDRDPTFDEVDLESEDFFYYVSKICNDKKWCADLTKAWAAWVEGANENKGDRDGQDRT